MLHACPRTDGTTLAAYTLLPPQKNTQIVGACTSIPHRSSFFTPTLCLLKQLHPHACSRPPFPSLCSICEQKHCHLLLTVYFLLNKPVPTLVVPFFAAPRAGMAPFLSTASYPAPSMLLSLITVVLNTCTKPGSILARANAPPAMPASDTVSERWWWSGRCGRWRILQIHREMCVDYHTYGCGSTIGLCISKYILTFDTYGYPFLHTTLPPTHQTHQPPAYMARQRCGGPS